MGLFGDDSSRDDYLQLEARVATLEAAMAQLTATVATLRGVAGGAIATPGGSTMPARWEVEARVLKEAGKAIEAIKLVREQTGWGLREAKDAVDRL